MPSKEVSQPIGSAPIKMIHLVPLAVYWSAFFGLGIYLKAPWAAIKAPEDQQKSLLVGAVKKSTRKETAFRFADLEYYKRKAYKELGREMVLAEAEMIWVPKAMESTREKYELVESVHSIAKSFSEISEEIEVKYVSTEMETME